MYFFHDWTNKLFLEDPKHCLKLERWRGPPIRNRIKVKCFFLFSMNTKFVYLVWHNRSDLFWWTFLPQILRNAPLNWRCNNECCAHGFILHCSHFFSVFFFFFSPKSDTIKAAPAIGAALGAKLGSRSQHGPGSSCGSSRQLLSGWWPSLAVGVAAPVRAGRVMPASR